MVDTIVRKNNTYPTTVEMFKKVIWLCMKIASLRNIEMRLSKIPFRSKNQRAVCAFCLFR